MTRRCLRSLSFLVTLAATLSLGTAPMRAESFHFQLSEPSTGVLPCAGEPVTGLLEGQILLAGTQTANGVLNLTAHIDFHGTFVGDLGHTFNLSATGTDQFSSLDPYIDLDFSGRAVSEGSGPIATFDGILRVYADDRPAEIVSWIFHC